ncbi:MAG TPA: ROK family protein [Trueperaceae bacterium]|nr:ROK family protein [Trueperaceae bacterium]
MNEPLLVLDYGGTKLSAGLVDRRSRGPLDGGGWLALERVKKPVGVDAGYDQTTMVELGRRLLNGRAPAAVGVSFGGPVEFGRGVVRLSHHVAGWENTPLRDQLSRAFDAPTRIDNDANAGALGEHRYGAGRGVDSLLYVTVSTGVGGGWVLGGDVWRGFEGMAGEFGHITIDPEGPSCVCGGRGCVERLASGPSMAAAAAEVLAARPGTGTVLRELARDGALTAVQLAAAAARGDEVALAALAAGARALGIALGSTANLINPQLFVLGGGVIKSGEPFWNVLLTTARAHAMPEVSLDIVKAKLGDDAPLWGAVALAHDALSTEVLTTEVLTTGAVATDGMTTEALTTEQGS